MSDGVGSYAKAIAAGIMASAAVVVTLTGAEIPGWLSEEWLLTLFAVVTPFLVVMTPNSD